MVWLKIVPSLLLLIHLVSGWNYGGGGYGWHDKIPRKIIVKHIPKHVPIYKPVPIPKHVPVPKPYGYLKPLAIAKPFKVPHVVPVIKHFQKPFPVLKGVPLHFPIPLPKLVKLPFQIKLPKPYVVRVPKPYAVAKKFPVAVPVHIPKPYIVPILKQVPVGVPHKVPKVINIVKEVPEYVKKPVPVYVEEQPYKHEEYSGGNYKGTPYVPSGGTYKGSPYPSGISGSNKGSPFPQGIGKGSPFPAGIGKGTPYMPSGKGGGSNRGKSSNVHATSAASFLAAHAGKLGPQSGGNSDILSAYSQSHAYSGLQGLAGGIHGGYHGGQGTSSGYQSFGGNTQSGGLQYGSLSQGQEHGGYDLHGLQSIGAYGSLGVYGRGAGSEKPQGEGSNSAHQEGYGQTAEEEKKAYGGLAAYGSLGQQGAQQNAQKDNDGAGGYQPPAYLGVSVTSFDHSGSGPEYQGEPEAGGYGNDGRYESHGNQEVSAQNEQQGYGAGVETPAEAYRHQAGGNGYSQGPQLALYKIQNGEITPLNYQNPSIQLYNSGYQNQNGYSQEAAYTNNQLGNGGHEPQAYQHSEGSDGADQGPYQQSSYGYQPQSAPYTGAQQSSQGYDSQQVAGAYGNQGSPYESHGGYPSQDGGYPNQDGGYPSQDGGYPSQNGGYPSQDDGYQSQGGGYDNQHSAYQDQGVAYQDQESYNNRGNSEEYRGEENQDSQGGYHSEVGYGNQNLDNLENYGLRAAYPVQPGASSQNQAHGAVYVRAYENQGEKQADYNTVNEEGYQAQDSQPLTSYAAYSPKVKTVTATTQQKVQDAQSQTAAVGRSFDNKSNDQIVGSSSGYSQPEGGDTKGGSWQAVP